MNKKDKHTTTFELDAGNPPPLTAKQEAALEALATMPDTAIDYSDIPPQECFYRPAKEMTTVRIDADVLAWLRGYGRGYQTRINAILRREMLSNKDHVK